LAPREVYHLRFTLDDAGRGASLVHSTEPETVTAAPARPFITSSTTTSARKVDDSHARRRQAARGDSQARRHRRRCRSSSSARPTAWTEQPRLIFQRRPELARDGYIYVAQDIRGRYKSEGEFIMSRPLADHRDPKAIDESTDAYDTVAWLLKNVEATTAARASSAPAIRAFWP
jgi:hypothetical protein